MCDRTNDIVGPYEKKKKKQSNKSCLAAPSAMNLIVMLAGRKSKEYDKHGKGCHVGC